MPRPRGPLPALRPSYSGLNGRSATIAVAKIKPAEDRRRGRPEEGGRGRPAQVGRKPSTFRARLRAGSSDLGSMDKEQKAALVEEIASDLSGTDTIFAIDYRGISVP